MTEPGPTHSTNGEACSTKACGRCAGLMWWITLIVAVIAVPVIAGGIALNVANPILQIALFIVACWFCTWAGMRLMRKVDEYHMKK